MVTNNFYKLTKITGRPLKVEKKNVTIRNRTTASTPSLPNQPLSYQATLFYFTNKYRLNQKHARDRNGNVWLADQGAGAAECQPCHIYRVFLFLFFFESMFYFYRGSA